VLVFRPVVAGQTAGTPTRTHRLVWFDRAGQRLDELETPPEYSLPVLAGDDRRVAVTVSAPASLPDVWTIDTQRGTTTRLTFSDGVDTFGVWSRDGARIVFSSGRDGVPVIPSSLYVRATNGTGTDERLLSGKSDELVVPFDWSPDGRFLLFGRAPFATWTSRFDLWTLELTGERTASPLIEGRFVKELARFSPDGRFVSYTSNESNGNQVFVQPFPEVGRGKWQISTRGGTDARWRADGRELFYLDPDGVLMSVDVNADGDSFEWSPPRPLFKTGVILYGPGEQRDYLYNVTSDGQRFLINEPVAPDVGSSTASGADDQGTGSLTVVVNWAAGLRAK
jgi:Tol biopolymer transport system component